MTQGQEWDRSGVTLGWHQDRPGLAATVTGVALGQQWAGTGMSPLDTPCSLSPFPSRVAPMSLCVPPSPMSPVPPRAPRCPVRLSPLSRPRPPLCPPGSQLLWLSARIGPTPGPAHGTRGRGHQQGHSAGPDTGGTPGGTLWGGHRVPQQDTVGHTVPASGGDKGTGCGDTGAHGDTVPAPGRILWGDTESHSRGHGASLSRDTLPAPGRDSVGTLSPTTGQCGARRASPRRRQCVGMWGRSASPSRDSVGHTVPA